MLLLLNSTALASEAPAIPKFIDETDTSGLQSRFEGEGEFMVGGGTAVFDCDGDGLPDIYVTAGVNKAKFYRNRSNKGGPIKLLEERSGLEVINAIGAYALDIDNDGQLDVVVLRVGEVQVYKGLGQCKFQRANEQWGIKTSNAWHTAFSATWEKGQTRQTGQTWPTLAIGTYTDRNKPEFPWGNCTPAVLIRPKMDTGGYQTSLALAPGHCALSMLFSDWNRSGVASLRVSNDREYYKNGEEQLWQIKPNQAPSLYTAAQGWKPLQIWGMGIASYDLNGDGYPEVFLTSMSDNKLQTLQSPTATAPQPRYVDTAYKRGVTAHRPYIGGDVHPSTAWHSQFADLNNDGFVDLFIAKGNVSTMPDFATLDPNNALLQKADGNFVEVGQLAGLASFKRGRGGMVVDLNADGLLDVIVINRWDKAELWRNVGLGTSDKPAAMGNWIQLTIEQAGSNRNAVGSWVEVQWLESGKTKTLRQELTVGGGHASGHAGWMHFGVGAATDLKVRVQWPSGVWSDWFAAKANGFYNLHNERGLRIGKAP